MDFEMDSDLEDVLEVDTSHNGIVPYLYEPRKTQADQELSESDEYSGSSEAENEEDDNEEIRIPSVSEWCRCDNCVEMPTMQECKCCIGTNIIDEKLTAAEISCVTQHEGFIVNCTNIHVLETSYYDYVLDSGPREEGQLIHELYRYIAYRRFTRWAYGLLGKRNRRVIPACAVNAIRSCFPSEQYTGFSYPQ